MTDLATPLEERKSIDSLLLTPKHSLPTIFLAHPSCGLHPAELLSIPPLAGLVEESEGSRTLADTQSKFSFTSRSPSDLENHLQALRSQDVVPDEGQTEIVVASDDSGLDTCCPLFDLKKYWATLDQERKRNGIRVKRRAEGSRAVDLNMGDLLFYTEAIGSTQSMLDKNTRLLHSLPSPLLSLASFQLSGRGRGSNSWISPPGCLQFSLSLTLPPSFPASKIVFAQYLFALAVCEGLDEDGKIGVRIKWPNDIYAEAEGLGAPGVEGKTRVKIGGILVTTSYIKGEWRIIIGCGINILNRLPTTSMSHLHSLAAERGRTKTEAPTMEGSLGRIIVAFEGMWERFVEEKGFDGFLDEYLGRWLHTNQKVTLTTTTPHEELLIKSITLDYGLLRCVKVGGGHDGRRGDWGSDDRTTYGYGASRPHAEEYVDLQPDGNSFDLMSGMIRKKT